MASKLRLEVDVDVQGANKLDGLGGSLSRVGAGLSKFVTVPLLGAGAAALALAADAEKADAKLRNVFDSMGAASFTSLEALEANAEALGQLSSFDDDEIKEAQATLLTFGNVTGDAFDRGIQAAVDMSELLGTDLQSATIQLGKALNDPVKGITALSRAGVSFTEQQKEQIATLVESGDVLGAQNIILAEMQRQFGGTAEALANTNAGQAAQAFEDLKNAGEDIGAILLPILGTLARAISGLANWFRDLDPAAQTFIVALGGVAAAVGPVLFVGGKLVGAFQAVGTAFSALKLVLLANPFVALAAAVVAIAALIILNWDKIVGFLKGVWDKIAGGVRTLANILEGAWNGIRQTVEAVWNAVVSIIKGAINGVIDVINGFFGFLNGIQIGVPEINVGPIHVGGGVIDPFNIPLIPRLAEGGIIDSPTLALIGESGPEAVVPLDRGGLGEVHYHSHIEVRGEEPFIRDEDGLIRANQRIAFLEGF